MTLFALLQDDVTRLTRDSDSCNLPCVEIKGSCQFIRYLKLHLNETEGYPAIIENWGGNRTKVGIEKLGIFYLTADESMETGYTATLL